MPTIPTKVALVGNPNAGKSSLFNLLTGLHQKVGNYPGVTVDIKSGIFQNSNGEELLLIDLPGTYSLHPNTQDEYLLTKILCNPKDEFFPDHILYVADSTQLDKQLLLLTQILDLGIPTSLILTMRDIRTKDSIDINLDKINKLLDIPILETDLKKENNKKEILDFVLKIEDYQKSSKTFFNIPSDLNNVLEIIQSKYSLSSKYQAYLSLNHFEQLNNITDKNFLKNLVEKYNFDPIRNQIFETMQRYDKYIDRQLIKKNEKKEASLTDKIDSVVTHWFLGPLFFFTLMIFIFQSIFSWSSYPMDLIDKATNFVILKVNNLLPNGIINDLITGGILPGLGGILIFIPQIAILFFIISILEESGYMSRVVFLFDKILSKFGLNGRSMIALISSGACAIPAVMSARTINNAKERLITIMVAPLISCSARLPVYALMIGFIVPKSYWLGFINYQTIAYICIYIISTLITLVVAWFLKTIIRSSENSMLMIPMPIYRMPTFKNILIIVFEKVKTFVLEAGKIMLIISILLWGLFRFSPTNNLELEKESLSYATEKKLTAVETEVYLNQQKIEHSYAGYLGKYIEPIIKPLGYDWKIGIGLIASFAAREVFVGTMSTIYSLESDGKNINKVEKMKKEKWDDGKPVYTLASSVSLILFYMFAMQCMSTVAVVKRETKSWKWPIIQIAYMTALAYLSAWIAYQLLQ